MNRRAKTVSDQKRRQRMTLLWIAAFAAIVITLLVLEQVALLYVLATLSMAVLLFIVAWADLGDRRRVGEPAPFDDSAAISDRLTPQTATPTAQTPQGSPRPVRARRR